MKSIYAVAMIYAAVLLASKASLAEAQDAHTCPKKLAVMQTVAERIADGWKSVGSNKEHPFIGISFSAGYPDKAMLLAPSKKVKKNKAITVIWEFPESDTGYWVSCEYGKTSATVAKELDRNIRVCTVEYDSRFSEPVVKKWGCSVSER